MSALSKCVNLIEKYRNTLGLEYDDLNLELIEMNLKTLYGNKGTDTLFVVNDSEPEYKSFMKKLLGANADKSLKELGEYQGDIVEDLQNKFFELVVRTVMIGVADKFEKERKIPAENFIKHFGKISYIVQSNLESKYVLTITEETDDLYKVFEDLNKVLDDFSVELSSEVVEISDDKKYIKELLMQDFELIDDGKTFLGRVNFKAKIVEWLRVFFKAQPMGGYPNRTLYNMSDLLKDNEINPRSADIWSPSIYTICEDLQVRLFVREDDISYTVLIKLPINADTFQFNNSSLEGNMLMLPELFSTRESRSTIMSKPRVCALKGTRNVSCTYLAIEVILCKDLLGFKQADWLLRDYIKACKGEKNKFSQFRNLSLGTKVVIGAMPGQLKAETFNCSGKNETSGIIGGGAGSGKTAMFDNLLVQMLALQGKFGDGAVVLLDAKQEWIPAWKSVFDKFNIPFYGFDGSLVTSECKWVNIVRGKKEVENIPFSITKAVAGVIFLRTLYEFIQYIQKEGCNASDISSYNSANVNFKGIEKIPRTAILCDEINTFYNNTVNIPELKNTFLIMTEAAMLTRTSGYMWLLGGQNPSKTIINSRAIGSLKYNIFGTMDDDTYNYFGVNQNEEVKKFEERNSTSDNKHPIMSQGMFYAGPKGACDLVKCLYLPENERELAIQDLGGVLPGMVQFDKIVRLALEMKFFDKYTFGLNKVNNVIYAVLHDLGVITKEEFDRHSDRVLNDVDSETIEVDNELEAIRASVGGELKTDNTPVYQSVKSEDVKASINNNDGDELKNVRINGSNSFSSFDDNDSTDNVTGGEDTEFSDFSTSQYVENRFNEENINSQPRQSINNMSEPNEYKREFKVSQDMVNMYTKSGNNINKVYAINQLSSELIKLIDNDFGIDRVHSFEVVGDGYMRINDTLYKPFLPNVVIEMLPVDIQQFVKEGKVIELFNFKDLYRFKGLEILSIENPRLAEGRVRRELGMTPKHDWMFIFKKFRNLQKVIIAGQDISDTTTSDSYQNSYKQGFNLGESLVNKFFGGNKPKKNRDYSAMNPLIHTGNGLASTMMKSRTCRVATKALGYTAGLKAVTVIASMLGPWGVLFGAMAVYGTVTQARKNGGLFADDGSQYANNGGMGYTNPLYEDDDYDDKPKSKSRSKSKSKPQQTRGKTNRD